MSTGRSIFTIALFAWLVGAFMGAGALSLWHDYELAEAERELSELIPKLVPPRESFMTKLSEQRRAEEEAREAFVAECMARTIKANDAAANAVDEAVEKIGGIAWTRNITEHDVKVCRDRHEREKTERALREKYTPTD